MPYINARAVTYVHKINACLAQLFDTRWGALAFYEFYKKNSIAFTYHSVLRIRKLQNATNGSQMDEGARERGV